MVENQAKSKHVPKLTPQMEAVKWKPGQSGNPKGRPKRKSLVELVQESVDKQELCDPKSGKKLKGDAILVALWFKYMAKQWPAFKEYLDRRDGKVNVDNTDAPTGAPVIIINNTLPGLDVNQRKR